MQKALISAIAITWIFSGCSSPANNAGGTTGGDATTGATDNGFTGTGSTDTGTTDTGSTDAGTTTAGTTGTGTTGTGSTDTGTTGTGSTDTGSTDGGTTGTIPSAGKIGDACSHSSDCEEGVCLALPSGYCTANDCKTNGCPNGSVCYDFEGGENYCLKSCTSNNDCRVDAGYICDADNVCWIAPDTPDPPAPGESPVGGPCNTATDCADNGATCYPAVVNGSNTGFINGYCIIFDCTTNSCPAGATCTKVSNDGTMACVSSCATTNDCRNTEGYTCYQPGICFPGCGQGSTCPTNYACDAEEQICTPSCTATSCGPNKVCGPDGLCTDPPCTATSCGSGMICGASGKCVPDIVGGPGAGPGPACNNLPAKDCSGSKAYCGQILQFDPTNGTGYTNYPLNGETWTNQYRSYARRDLQILIKWATAYVDCKGKSWGGGNGFPLGLGDMSESNGAIPGTSIGSPGHPAGTHVDGYDMDIAYYQNTSPDNYLRPVCNHKVNGADQYHCVGEPYLLDLWRSALFIGALITSDRTRVIGVDGKVGSLIEQAMPVLCGQSWLPQTACTKIGQALAYEVTNTGKGWFKFHHHHLHVSLWGVAGKPGDISGPQCLVPNCTPINSPVADTIGCMGDMNYSELPAMDYEFIPVE